MKYVIYTFLITTLLFSCKSKTKETVIDSVAVAPLSQTDSLLQKFKPVIHGVWVKSDYIKKVIVTGSPLAAADKAEGITCLEIDTARIKGDKLTAGISLNNHEGGDVTIKFRKGNAPETIQLDNAELGYSIENNDTILVLTETNEAHEKVVTRFIKSTGSNTDGEIGEGIAHLINKNLFSGSYVMTDSIGKISNVTFTDNGKITGLASMRTYSVQNDFVAGPDNTLDMIMLEDHAKKRKDYVFKISGNTLKLFDTKTAADSMSLVVDKLVYTLVKNK